jgi:hypothetical protein
LIIIFEIIIYELFGGASMSNWLGEIGGWLGFGFFFAYWMK